MVYSKLTYKEKEKEPDIISYNNASDKISLQANSIEEIIIPHDFSVAIVDKVNIEILYYNTAFSIMIEETDEDTLKLLKDDNIFMEKLIEINKKFNLKYEYLKKLIP
jgi:hypothetical protein